MQTMGSNTATSCHFPALAQIRLGKYDISSNQYSHNLPKSRLDFWLADNPPTSVARATNDISYNIASGNFKWTCPLSLLANGVVRLGEFDSNAHEPIELEPSGTNYLQILNNETFVDGLTATQYQTLEDNNIGSVHSKLMIDMQGMGVNSKAYGAHAQIRLGRWIYGINSDTNSYTLLNFRLKHGIKTKAKNLYFLKKTVNNLFNKKLTEVCLISYRRHY